MTAKFEFTAENGKKFEEILGRYPVKRAALLPALNLAQEQNGYISLEVESFVAELLNLPEVDVHEVVTFYTLYKQRLMGRHHIRLCANIACWIRGCDAIKNHLSSKLEAEPGEVTKDGKFSWETVECMGACELAPMMQVDDDYYGNLTPQKVDEVLNSMDGQ